MMRTSLLEYASFHPVMHLACITVPAVCPDSHRRRVYEDPCHRLQQKKGEKERKAPKVQRKIAS
jgi:hypothetical protein